MWKNLKSRFASADSFVSLALGLAVVLVIGLTIINYVRNRSQTATSTKQEQEAAGAPVALPTQHTVVAGETLWSISEKYYRSGYNWTDISKANNLTDANRIESGQTLTIPNVTPIPVPTGAVSSASVTATSQNKSYTVVRGDYLWDIARRQYGNGYKWVDIAKANNLKNPNVIHAGNVLVLP